MSERKEVEVKTSPAAAGDKKRNILNIRAKKILISLGICLLLFYIAGVLVFNTLYPIGSRINGISISFMTKSDAMDHVSQEMMSQKVDVIYAEGFETAIKCSDVCSSADNEEIEYSLDAVSSGFNPWSWFVSFSDSSLSVINDRILDPDEKTISSLIEKSEYCSNDSLWYSSQDAYIDYNDDKGLYTIIDDVQGTEIDVPRTSAAVSSLFKEKSSDILDIEESGLYKCADIQSDGKEIKENLQLLNSRLDMSISYDDGETILDGKTITEWMLLEDGSVTLDPSVLAEKAAKFVSESLSPIYSTDATSHTFKAANGETRTVKGGNLSKTVSIDNESEAIADIIISGQSEKDRKPETDGYERSTNGGLGSTFVEIDMTKQKCYYVEKGKIKYKSDCVTGTYTNKGRRTPEGVYYIYFMQKGRTLTGENNEYATYVNYWMAFNVGIGLHDATWRSSFGGDIYMYSGSHGCINLPLDFAKKLYGDLKIGIPVVCYY